jgi:hypothetical protein
MTTETKRMRIVAFRCPPVLESAMEAAAKEGMYSISDIARQAILKDMRMRGLLEESKT